MEIVFDNLGKIDMAATRAAHIKRMEEIKKYNTKERAIEEKRKLDLRQKIEAVELARENEKIAKELAINQLLKSNLKSIKELVKIHIGTLYIKYCQLNFHDEYGVLSDKKWIKEKQYFISKVVKPQIPFGFEEIEISAIDNIIEAAIKRHKIKSPSNPVDVENLSPFDFEIFCAEELKKLGWTTLVTKKSGDQGVDVVAEKGKNRLAIQCKKYSSAVGNSAVQEICAGMQFVKAKVGVVVSNAKFTPQAKQLAKSTNTLLLHYSEIENIEKLIKNLSST